VQQRVARVLASRRTRAGHPDAYTTSLAPPLRAQRLSGGHGSVSFDLSPSGPGDTCRFYVIGSLLLMDIEVETLAREHPLKQRS
jgi:hypothetical protein